MIDASRATIAILTALPKECAAVRSMLEDEERVPGPAGDGQRAYYVGRIPADNGGSHVVVVALLPDMGNNSAAVSSTRLLADFKRVKHLIMCGIAGGVPKPGDPEHDVRLGDIVVSNRHGVVQYDLIKERPDGSKEHRHPPRPPGAALLGAVRHLQTEEAMGRRPWEARLPRGAAIAHGQRPADDVDARGEPITYPIDPCRRPGLPRAFDGTIAAANILLKNAAHRDYLGKTFSVKAVEMEGSGVADAAWSDGSAGYLVVRGICDYCDDKKGNVWQGAAAVAAAAYTCAVVAAMPGPRAASQRAAGPRVPKPASKPGSKKPAAAAAPPTAPALEQDPGSDKAPGDRLRVLVFHGPDNASKNELLAWLRGPEVNVDARTVGEMVATASGVVDDRVDQAIAWADKFIAVVTPDPRSPSGAPNVIDEIGRVRGAGRGADLAILRQRTCADLWSNLAGVVRIEFDKRTKEVSWSLARFLGLGRAAAWEPRREAPISPRSSRSRTEDEPAQPARDDSAQALRAWLEERLKSAPRAATLIAATAPMDGRVAAATPAAVADALLAASASTVAQALNDAHAKADASTRPALAELMFRVLPFTADLVGARQRATAAVARGERTIELPFRSETLAEIVSAGVDGRPIEVDASPSFPLGLRSVVIPPTSYAPLFASHNEVFVHDVVLGLCHEKGDVSDEFVKLKHRFERNPEDLRKTVEVLLRELHDSARPRYLLFIDEDLAHDTERSLDELWGLVRGAVEHPERGVAGLRLIRLQGGPDQVASEFTIALKIKAVAKGR